MSEVLPKCLLVLTCKSSQILIKLELFHADGWTERRTDRHDQANSCFLQFCEHVYKRSQMYICEAHNKFWQTSQN